MPDSLLFTVTVDDGKRFKQADWDRIAARLKRAAQGRAKGRTVTVGAMLIRLN